MQALLSNGTAPDDEATLKQMQDMHPALAGPLKPHQPTGDQVSVSVSQVKRLLFSAASKGQDMQRCIQVVA